MSMAALMKNRVQAVVAQSLANDVLVTIAGAS